MAFNANNIGTKKHEFCRHLQKYKIDICLINETHLKPFHTFKIQNYIIYRNDREPGKGGGTAIAIKHGIPHKRIHLPPLLSLEATGVIVPINNVETLLGAVYKPPDRLLAVHDITELSTLTDKCILAGDLNAKHTAWHSRLINRAGAELYRYHLNNDININAPTAPTRYHWGRGMGDVLDIVIYKNINISGDITVLHELPSDHLPIHFQILEGVKCNKAPQYIVKNTNWGDYQVLLSNLIKPNANIQSKEDIESSISNLVAAIRTSYIINTESQQSHNPTVINLEIEKLLEIKKQIRIRWARTLDPTAKAALNWISKTIKSKIRQRSQEHWENCLDECQQDISKMWKLTRSMSKKLSAPPPTVIIGNSGTKYDPVEQANTIADSLEQQFRPHDLVQIARKQEVESLATEKLEAAALNNYYPLITPTEIKTLVTKINTKKSPGPDQVPTGCLKFLPRKALIKLTHIYNACLKFRYFPKQWKEAKIITIPKQGTDPSLPQNLRPISLLSPLGKIFEKALLKRINSVITENDTLPSTQFGFRARHGTNLQLLRLVDHITTEFNNKASTAAVFLDIEKAFDRTWYPGLICKLADAGIPAYLLTIIKSYLTDRTFRVQFNQGISTARNTEAGVPQGSVLAPVLYNIFTHDIPSEPGVHLALYADDTAVYTSAVNIKFAIPRLQRGLNRVVEWCQQWNIKINNNKTQAIVFTKRKPRTIPRLQLQGRLLPLQNTTKYLGVILDRSLTFKNHIENACIKGLKSTRAQIPLLRSQNLNLHVKKIIYSAIVRSRLTYACPAWSHAAHTNIHKLQVIQNKALRIILQRPRLTNITDLHEEAQIETVQQYIEKITTSQAAKLRNHPNTLVQQIGTRQARFRKHRRPSIVVDIQGQANQP